MADEHLPQVVTGGMRGEEVANRAFGVVRKGFDQREVRGFLARVARELDAAYEREAELRRLLADAERRAANPQLDPEVLTNALGEETARVLRSAHDAAHEVRSRAEEQAARVLREAEAEAAAIKEAADRVLAERTSEAEAAAAEIRRAAAAEAEAVREAARAEAESVLSAARGDGQRLVEEAQAERSRVLSELGRRQKALHVHIERLQAARDSLLEALQGARAAFERVDEGLREAEADARRAAQQAAERASAALHHGTGLPTGPRPKPVPHAGGAPPEDTEVRNRAVSERTSEPPTDLRAHGAPHAPDAPDEAVALEGTPAEPVVEKQPAEPPRASAPARPAVAGGPGEPPESGPPAEAALASSVEELFARIRAARELEVARARTTLAADKTGQARAPARATPPLGHGSEPSPVVPEGGETSAPEPAGIEPVGAEAGSQATPEPAGGSDTEPVAEEPARRRDALVGPVLAALVRRLKWALQDEQNELLDRLRAGAGNVVLEEVVRAERYREASIEWLARARAAGAAFFGLAEPGGGDHAAEQADQLGNAVAEELRRRLGAVLEEAPDEAEATNGVGAAYREWKGRLVEAVAADYVTTAFARGGLDAAPPGLRVRWVVDDDGGSCPDCDDNALAGDQVAGEPFPTGQSHPPIHPGCRCFLAPASG